MDVPMDPDLLARLNFWALDPEAAELDPTIQLEPQIVAVDAFSQLFAESASFHFGFLTDLDNEYHRLRDHGVVGILNETSVRSPWYALYHYWRNQVQAAYLDTNLVALPAGAQQGNWRIIDVLNEVERLMAPDGSNLFPDIYLCEGCIEGTDHCWFWSPVRGFLPRCRRQLSVLLALDGRHFAYLRGCA